VFGLERPEKRLLGTENLDGGARGFGKVHDGARVGDQACADEFTNESCEVGCEGLHAGGEVVGEVGAVLCQVDDLLGQGRSGFEIFVRDFCAHGDFGSGLDGGLDFLGEDGLGGLACCAWVKCGDCIAYRKIRLACV
jgi:hypothetical protein